MISYILIDEENFWNNTLVQADDLNVNFLKSLVKACTENNFKILDVSHMSYGLITEIVDWNISNNQPPYNVNKCLTCNGYIFGENTEDTKVMTVWDNTGAEFVGLICNDCIDLKTDERLLDDLRSKFGSKKLMLRS